jgi:hypothetical protein
MVVNCQLHAVIVLSTYPFPPPSNPRSWTEGRVGLRAGLDVVSKKFILLTGNQFCRQITLKFQPTLYNQTCTNRPAVYPWSPATYRITITVLLITFSRQRWRQMYVREQVRNHYHFESNVKNLIRVRKKISQSWTSPTNQLVICDANNRQALHGPLCNTTLQRIS